MWNKLRSVVGLVLAIAVSLDGAQTISHEKRLKEQDIYLVLHQDGSGYSFKLEKYSGDVIMNGKFGFSLPGGLLTAEDCTNEFRSKHGNKNTTQHYLFTPVYCYKWGEVARFEVEKPTGNCYDITWTTDHLNIIEDCFDIEEGGVKWYGGAEELKQHFPLNPDETRKRVPFLPGDMLQNSVEYFGGVAEPYWLNSLGGSVYVTDEQPLFFSWNQNYNKKMCLSTTKGDPYPDMDSNKLELKYKICGANNPRAMHEYAATNFWRKPTDIPDERMMTYPVWSTWAQYKEHINQSIILDFADQITSNGFNNSQLEIDDNWEQEYGDAIFNSFKFPDPARMVTDLKSRGFRVTLWTHPFINVESERFAEGATDGTMYLVRTGKGKVTTAGYQYLPGLTLWWQGFAAGCVDFTREESRNWWNERLDQIRDEIGIDSFKFDAGESNWLPEAPVFNKEEDKRTWPGIYSTRYVEHVAKFGGMTEVRTARHTQHLPIFVRMLDKNSRWGYDNGLKSMVTTLLQFSMTGYPFVLPDMVGGNGYLGVPSRELYIRWMQVNVFMPAIQISYVPWIYDDQVVQHSREMVQLHEKYAPEIIRLAMESKNTGLGINRPIWWIDPTDQIALTIDSEFLLGNNILVAPVLESGAVTRDIYLPTGTWMDMVTNTTVQGPTWLTNYSADLYTLPYFVLQD